MTPRDDDPRNEIEKLEVRLRRKDDEIEKLTTKIRHLEEQIAKTDVVKKDAYIASLIGENTKLKEKLSLKSVFEP